MAFSPRNISAHQPHEPVALPPAKPALIVSASQASLFPEAAASHPSATAPIDNGPASVVTEAHLAGLLALIDEGRYDDLNAALAALAPATADLYAYNLLAHHPRDNRPFTETPADLLDVLFQHIDAARLVHHHEGCGLLNHGWPRLVMWRLGERWERNNARAKLDASARARLDALDEQLAYLLAMLEERGAYYGVDADRFKAAAAAVRLFRIGRYLVRTQRKTGVRMMRYIRGINDASHDRVFIAAWNVHGHLEGPERYEVAENIAHTTMHNA